MPANQAKDAVSANPKRVLLNARESRIPDLPRRDPLMGCVEARRTFKGVMSMPKVVPPQGPSSVPVDTTDLEVNESKASEAKRHMEATEGSATKRLKTA